MKSQEKYNSPDVEKLYHRVQRVSSQWKQAIERNDEETEGISEHAMETLSEIGAALSNYTSENLQEVSVKINLWRVLAP